MPQDLKIASTVVLSKRVLCHQHVQSRWCGVTLPFLPGTHQMRLLQHCIAPIPDGASCGEQLPATFCPLPPSRSQQLLSPVQPRALGAWLP